MRTSEGNKYTLGEDLMHTVKNGAYAFTKSLTGLAIAGVSLGYIAQVGYDMVRPTVELMKTVGRENIPDTVEEVALTLGFGAAAVLFGKFIYPTGSRIFQSGKAYHQGGMAESAENTEGRSQLRGMDHEVTLAKRRAKTDEKLRKIGVQATDAV